MKVISASRRTDLVRWYPDQMCRVLADRHPPETVHTVVIWTKFPAAVLTPPVRDVLSRYRQVVVHCTVTGLGATAAEPGAPDPARALESLPRLWEFLGDSDRLIVRVDPLVRITVGDVMHDNSRPVELLAELGKIGVRSIVTSFATSYPRARNRAVAIGAEIHDWTAAERATISRQLTGYAREHGIEVYGCCTPEFPARACIDGVRLRQLHPDRERPPLARAGGQRPLCLCSKSIDIGWYGSHPCSTGCLYCYANPVIQRR